MNQGEYFTRDSKGKIEIFQAYIEGGRTTPYTLKELYRLKGTALRNSLEDIFYGMGERIRQIGKSPVSDAITKEEQLAKVFSKVDSEVSVGRITRNQANELQKDMLSKFRADSKPRVSRIEIRNDIDRITATRVGIDRERIPTNSEVRQRLQEYQDRVNRQTRAEGTTRRIIEDRIRAEDRIVSREIAREIPRDTLRELPREIPREIARVNAREAPRIIPRESIRETPRQGTREIPREQPHETPREITRITPRETLRGTPRIPPKYPPIKTTVKFHGGEIKNLTQKDIDSAIAWKQGFFYKSWFPPYDKNSMVTTREPVAEVKYYSGVGSAAKSIVARFGDIPDHLRYDMGIQDIDIFKGSKKKKPTIRFKQDRKQSTSSIGIVSTR